MIPDFIKHKTLLTFIVLFVFISGWAIFENQCSLIYYQKQTLQKNVNDAIVLISKNVRQSLGYAMVDIYQSRVLQNLYKKKEKINVEFVSVKESSQKLDKSIILLNHISQKVCWVFFQQTQKNNDQTLWQFNGKIFHGNPPLSLVCPFKYNQIGAKAIE